MSEIFNIYENSFKALCKKIDATLNVDEYNSKNLNWMVVEINSSTKSYY